MPFYLQKGKSPTRSDFSNRSCRIVNGAPKATIDQTSCYNSELVHLPILDSRFFSIFDFTHDYLNVQKDRNIHRKSTPFLSGSTRLLEICSYTQNLLCMKAVCNNFKIESMARGIIGCGVFLGLGSMRWK